MPEEESAAALSAAEYAPPPSSHRRWRIAVLLGIGVLINFFDRVNLSVSQAALRDAFGITALTFGFLSSAYSWTYAALQIPVGVFLDRFGVKSIGRISTFLWSLASFAAAIAPGIGTFLGARLLLGVGEASTFPSNAKAVGYWFPESERSFATSINDAAAKFASAIGVPILGVLLIHFGWRWSFAFTGILSFAYFLLFWHVYRNPGDDAELTQAERQFILRGKAQPESATRDYNGAPLLYLIRQPQVIGASIGFAAYNYGFYLLLTWLPSYLSMSLHVDLLHSVLYTSVPWLIATFTDLFVGGWLVDTLIRRGCRPWLVRQSVLVLGMAFGAGLFGAGFAHTPGRALFWISLSIGGLGAMAPVGWSIPSLISPRESVGRIGGIMNFVTQISAISAPIITGWFAQRHNFRGAFTVAAVVLAIGIAGYVLFLGKMRLIPEPVHASVSGADL
ncbi:MFS transporter [Paracidobacterium acidisoli]|uniref:MFS transporter n=1 Tax=Paracidobacterium acidisoli TaxID=2303751 RepID=A0A372IMQ1_9BACT|nr:MFS transporter [Paracidobacterium acidisoli]MBT9331783.1 MFS transporter [Paracidobacterium acidisoli]